MDVEAGQLGGDPSVELRLHLGVPVRDFKVTDAFDSLVFVNPDQPQDGFAPRGVGVPRDAAGCLLSRRPLAFKFHAKVLARPTLSDAPYHAPRPPLYLVSFHRSLDRNAPYFMGSAPQLVRKIAERSSTL